MKMQTLRVGVTSLAAAALISIGVTTPTAGAAPAVKTYSTNCNNVSMDTINQIAQQYGIDLSKITFGGITIQLPTQVTNPSTGTGNTTTPTKPTTPTTPSKPTTPTTPSKPTTPTTPSKPSTGSGNTGSNAGNTGSTGNTGSNTGSNAGSGTVSQSEFASQVVTLVNKERANAGLKALTSDALLTKVATAKAQDMYQNNYFDHNSPTYGSPFDMMKSFGVTYNYAGENIAMGQKSPTEVMTAWMNSAGHRANILNANYTKIGVAYVNGEWVQEFTG
ncbi:putative YkwD family protein [Paenibacillus sp. BK033]|uniref:CAP domain-containing protein n=1 Tax=Paenibacillus sp. BK033 TaxID=2512133 RepID=UPI001042C5E7|nr:CAP domain-containing protein [Paenibacillus sp. BK033]TCM98061.1 putative YkwD family protein [Paenibacillus sp. BK033]